MKSRKLHTIHDLIVTNYRVTQLPSGKFLHQFNPQSSDRVYEFEANSTRVLVNGERYNVGFTPTPDGRCLVDTSALGKVDTADKVLSYQVSKQLSADIYAENRAKNDERVSHRATDGGYYWGKKYAWRRYGLVIAKEAFYKYLTNIGHPSVPCVTSNPDLPFSSNEHSTAYLDHGLEEAMDALIESAVKVGRYYESPLYPDRFQIKAINAITDKR
ncbi:hypothetical protein BVH06_03015 [Pseudomonas sp. PA27(2017)]|nr:hypothetical protein BVH06_03015 [Pseudomonas sp. PA27(2017)]